MRRTLAATIAAATVALGLAFPTKSACKITVGGKVGYRQCNIAPTEERFDGRRHVFVVGSNRQIYYIWQLWRGGSAYSDWTSLGGQGYGRVSTEADDFGRPWMQVKVLGYNGQSFRNYCKYYWSGTGRGWTQWFGC
jgi:hypothetical protein